VTEPLNYGRHAARTYDVVTDREVEPKVKAASGAGAGASLFVTPFLVWLLDLMFWNGDADPPVPLPVVGMVGFVVAGLSSLAAGYVAKHVQRVPA
jgi:drug/metabolite transporter (DMT)-like permease